MKILVAEDDVLMATILEKTLLADGYDIFVAHDGREALELIETKDPDIIITDIMMPFTSGLEIIGVVKANYNKIIPVIVLSGMDEEATVLEAFELGADDFLTKPFNTKELSTRVKRAVKLIKKK